MAKDYYEILGLLKSASDEEVKKAYRDLALQILTERRSNTMPGQDELCQHRFRGIMEAYSVLSNPERRQEYDRSGRESEIFEFRVSPKVPTDRFNDHLMDGLKNVLDPVFTANDAIAREFAESVGPDERDRMLMSAVTFMMEVMKTPTRPVSNIRQVDGPDKEGNIHFEWTITKDEAKLGTKLLLQPAADKTGVQLRTSPGMKSGHIMKLSRARVVFDGHPGDILVKIKVK